MLNTFMSLEAQRVTALKDLDKLENLKAAAKKRPYKFIKQLQKGELVSLVKSLWGSRMFYTLIIACTYCCTYLYLLFSIGLQNW